MLKTTVPFMLQLLLLWLFSMPAIAQPTWTLNPFGKEKKPEQYEEKRLPSEKTGEKKFNAWRRFKQNTTTHYNYYFNANNKLNAVIERATLSQQDDFSKLLSFYPYSLENTAAQQTELDSVIYKATAAILLHDLRSDWVDNMYLLIGKSYFLRNELDSAAMTFQFINYNLFPRKKKEDDSRIVGTNNEPGSGYLSIANKEDRNVIDKVWSTAPSRNDALVWLARTFTAKEEYGDAAGMINILRNDPNLPPRLRNDLEEVTAYWFFAQNSYDSAAIHLENALSVADTKQDKSRWEFLLAQLNERHGQFEKASGYYDRAATHTVDPIMEIYARLNNAKMMRDNGDEKQLDASIANLLKMAKKDKYDNYRDIIYYSAAQLGLKKPDTTNSIGYLQRAVKYNSNNQDYRNKSFLKLADIAYGQARFKEAAAYYDSLQLSTTQTDVDLKELNERKASLAKLVSHLQKIDHEDSTQRIAALPDAERDAFVKKLLRKLRKEQGLKEEDVDAGTSPISFGSNRAEALDLFTSNNSKGDWYFYNNNLKSKGYNDFVSRWGKRANVDNWRKRKNNINGLNLGNVGGDVNTPLDVIGTDSAKVADLTIDGLMQGLPLTPEKRDSSNKRIALNMVELAKVFQNDLQEYALAINTYEDYLDRFPGDLNEAEAYLGLYFSYSKLGNLSKANFYKNLLTTKHSGSTAAVLITNPSLLQPDLKNNEGTARYESIYNLFIEGKFPEAIEEKKKADSLYGNNYWTPQLLYIESIYHIREKNDSVATALLKNLQTLYPGSPLKDKAATMVEVLGRRAQIEDYLTKLEVTRAEEEKIIIVDETAPIVKQAMLPPTPVTKPAAEQQIKTITRDSSFSVAPISVKAGFSIQPEKQHYVVVLLEKVDGVYINEARTAFTRFNKGNYLTQNLIINRDTLDASRTLFLISKFEDAQSAIVYHDKIKKAAPREVSWLPANKYSFFIISEENLLLLKSNKDLAGYKQLLNASLGNKF